MIIERNNLVEESEWDNFVKEMNVVVDSVVDIIEYWEGCKELDWEYCECGKNYMMGVE